jgi:predicted ArsR family transcriptional regulator
MMQKTRQRILEYLKLHGEATVDELSKFLDHLTPVTVRHHLDVMRSEGLVEAPEIRRRITPGRPRYIYRLSANAQTLFPTNMDSLTGHILDELKDRLDDGQINVIFAGVADRMASALPPAPDDEPLKQRLSRVVALLSEQGYMASWEAHPEGYILHTRNCPYNLADEHPEMCALDVRYISNLLGTVPRRLSHLLEGDHSCSYLVIDPYRVAV